MSQPEIIELETGWEILQKGITKVKDSLQEISEEEFNSKGYQVPCSGEEYAIIYSTVFKMCTQKGPHDWSRQLYDRYRESFEEYITSVVLPALWEKHDELLLRELVKQWRNYKIMDRLLARFFDYLDRYFIRTHFLPALNDVSVMCFRDLVYQEIKNNVRDAMITLVDREPEGEQIDRGLLKNVLGIFVEIGMGNMDAYENDFESAMLDGIASYYSRKAASWILEDSCTDYMLKAEECLKRVKERASYYLHSSSEQKLLEKVENELLSQYESQLLEKELPGCHALLRDEKVDDLSRMYRLFCRIRKGLEPLAQVFKQYVTDEVTSLVKHAQDAANNEKEFLGEVLKLCCKRLQYVNECFMDHSLFHKALKEAFGVFCNKEVTGKRIAELLVTFFDNILKKGGSEKLNDEYTLEEVVKLLPYVSDEDLFAEFYSKKLAQRLLFAKSANDDETNMLTKLKRQCGYQFTSKMERMVTDLTLGRENQNNFEEYLNENPLAHPGIDLTVTVLTTGFWPSYKLFDLNLPSG